MFPLCLNTFGIHEKFPLSVDIFLWRNQQQQQADFFSLQPPFITCLNIVLFFVVADFLQFISFLLDRTTYRMEF